MFTPIHLQHPIDQLQPTLAAFLQTLTTHHFLKHWQQVHTELTLHSLPTQDLSYAHQLTQQLPTDLLRRSEVLLQQFDDPFDLTHYYYY